MDSAEMSGQTDDSLEVQAMIAELATNSAQLSKLLHDTVSLLAELVVGVPVDDPADAPEAAGPGPLSPAVLEIATLQAQAAGISVEDYLRDAVLAYAAFSGRDGASGDGDRAARSRQAREEAHRVLAESTAVKAQSAQAAARATRAQDRAQDGHQAAEQRTRTSTTRRGSPP